MFWDKLCIHTMWWITNDKDFLYHFYWKFSLIWIIKIVIYCHNLSKISETISRVLCFHWWLSGNESAWNAGDVGSIPGSEDPLEKEMTTHSSILVWEIPLQRNMVGYSPWDYKKVGHDIVTKQQKQKMIQKSENCLGDKKHINL